MSGINVLSDSLSGGTRLDKTPSLKGKNATDSGDNPTAEFAVMLNGLTTSADPMGQMSKNDQDLEAGQDPNSVVQNLGYGQYVLSYLSQPVGLGDLPAGKEANSGNGVNQGSGEGLRIEDNFSLVAMNKPFSDSNEEFASKGMLSQIPQGNNPGTAELDIYRKVIAELLVELSGQITDKSPGAALASKQEISGHQEIIKQLQGWLTATNEVPNNQRINRQALGNIEEYTSLLKAGFGDLKAEASFKLGVSPGSGHRIEDGRQIMAMTAQDRIQGVDPSDEGDSLSIQKLVQPLVDFLTNEQDARSGEQRMKGASLLTVLNQLVTQVQEASSTQEILKKEMLQTNNNKLEALFNPLKNTGQISEALTTVRENPVLDTDYTQKFAEIESLNDKPLKNPQEVKIGEGNKADQTVSKLPELNVLQNHNQIQNQDSNQNLTLNQAIGVEAKFVTGNVVDGKTVAVPVWEQVSDVFREQVMSRNQELKELKELDIQLHPADLGRIRIGLRWENGQVHLLVHASEAATGLILQNQLTELRTTLTNQGVNCGMLQMGQQGRDQQQHQNPQGDQWHRTPEFYSNTVEEEEPFSVAKTASSAELNHRINVTA